LIRAPQATKNSRSLPFLQHVNQFFHLDALFFNHRGHNGHGETENDFVKLHQKWAAETNTAVSSAPSVVKIHSFLTTRRNKSSGILSVPAASM